MSKDGVAKVKDVFGNDIVPGIASVFGPLSNFSTTFTDFGKTLEGLGTDILGGAKGLIDKAGKLGKDAGSWVADKAKQAGGAIKQGADVVKRDAGKVWDSGVGFAKNIIGVPPEVAAAAKKAEEKYGVPAAITTAQWQLESGGGKHMPTGSNNPFGIKAKAGQESVFAGTQEFEGGQMVSKKQEFAKFSSLDEAFEEHAKLLARGKAYDKARNASSLEDYADALTGTYATDPEYGEKLKSIMSKQQVAQPEQAKAIDKNAVQVAGATPGSREYNPWAESSPAGEPTVEAATNLPPIPPKAAPVVTPSWASVSPTGGPTVANADLHSISKAVPPMLAVSGTDSWMPAPKSTSGPMNMGPLVGPVAPASAPPVKVAAYTAPTAPANVATGEPPVKVAGF